MPSSFVCGFHPVREALRSHPERIQEVLLASVRRNRRREQIQALCQEHQVACREVPTGELDRLAGQASHNGVAARLQEEAAPRSTGDESLVVLVEDVQDPRNLGALLRVCEGAGVGRVLIRHRGSAPISEVARRTSAGASEWLRVERITNTSQAIRELQEDEFWIYGAAGGGTPPWELDLSGKVALVIGGEEKGLRRLTRERCDALVGLPMRGRVESLNLSTAAAALLYEAVRQRFGGGQ